jgi:hypothetical protein
MFVLQGQHTGWQAGRILSARPVDQPHSWVAGSQRGGTFGRPPPMLTQMPVPWTGIYPQQHFGTSMHLPLKRNWPCSQRWITSTHALRLAS